MKHTLTVNQQNTPEHIIHLDYQQLPLNVKPLPKTVAYQIQDTTIHVTTTQTLQNQTLQQIRQKNKHLLQKTILIIIKNTKHTPKLQIQTIQENPQITTHTTTQEQLPQLLKQLIQENTPQQNKAVTIQENPDKTYTLQHDKTPIKTYHNREYTTIIQKTLTQHPTMTLQEAEYQAQRQYYKHISYDKTNQTYKITLNEKTHSIHKKLQHAIQERNLQTNRQEPEEETLCQNNHIPLEPLPPTPWNNTITQTRREHNKYQTKKRKKQHNTQQPRHNNTHTNKKHEHHKHTKHTKTRQKHKQDQKHIPHN